ncbi:MAG: lipopolysaccharide biosynthesis protein [Nocardioidaceae bacterium]|nr:lipopolysaccharide biosynthesis protein [Nocardioidaceae bacterium]
MPGTEPIAPEAVGGRARQAVRWSALAILAKQGCQMAGALVLARILGPSSYGVISVATVYVTLTTLLLDQGLASALIQRPDLGRRAVGAVTTVNLLSGIVLGALTWVAAPWLADFFDVDGLTPLLRVLGAGLLLKAVAITPRAMLMRAIRLRPVAVADVLGSTLGVCVAVSAALSGAGYFSMLGQVLATDLVLAVVLLVAGGAARPNLDLAALRTVLPYGLRIFGVNGLAFFSRNADNILVGRFLGVTSLSYYSMAYRVLVIPVQLLGQTVNRVLFPAFSRIASDRDSLATNLLRATETLAMAAVLPMVLAAVAAPELVALVLGPSWAPTVPILAVLAVAGARETVFYVTGALMRATGAAGTNLRYEILATVVQLTGIVIGLQFGLLGVALGYATAGFALVPVLLVIQRRLTGVSWAAQLGTLLPPVHACLWGAAAYLGVGLLPLVDLAHLLVGSAGYVLVALAVLRLMHRAALRRTTVFLQSLAGRAPRAAA